MNTIAFVFTHAPHGNSLGREGLDAIFSISSIIQKISLFFIGDGVLQLIKSSQSEKILSRDYVVSFSALTLYGIEDCYCCQHSLTVRGLEKKSNFILKTKILNPKGLYLKLNQNDAIINF